MGKGSFFLGCITISIQLTRIETNGISSNPMNWDIWVINKRIKIEKRKKTNVCHILLAFVLFLIFVLKREIGMNVGGGEVDGI